jgi:ubiquinone/menaquinone biosynthesis C-methylase UbiE
MSEQNERVLDQFKQQANAYAALVNNSTEKTYADPLIELIAPGPADYLLDVGCGTGQFVVKVAALVAHATGMDLTPAMLEQARAHQAAQGITNVTWQEADSIALPVPDASFSLVTSRAMLHHAADPAATIAEMRRVCKAGGRIGVMDLSFEPTKAPAFDAFEVFRDPSHHRTLTAAELRQLGKDLGLREIAFVRKDASLPFEAVLATSFPPAGVINRVRSLLQRDLDSRGDAFGLRPELRDNELWVTYPQAIVVWQR